jgi:acetyl esterase/lipase
VSAAYRFDPELAEAAARLPARDLGDLESARRPRTPPTVDTPDDVATQDVTVRTGARPLLLRLFQPADRTGLTAGIVQLHAGGFVLGSLAQDHQRNVRLVRDLGVTVVSVDYSLAPEHPYPSAVDEAYCALCWTHDQAAEIGVDAERIIVHGRSAGGGLAAAVALMARDRGGPAIRFLFLATPQLDDRGLTASMAAFDDTPMWDRRATDSSWRMYLGDEVPGADSVPIYAAPARATDLTALPPTYISAMQFDPLRDEALEFGGRLLAAGVPTEIHVYPGTFHGSAALAPDAEVSRRERAEEYAVLARVARPQP